MRASLRLLPLAPPTSPEAFDQDLLSFDFDDDEGAIIPMPPSISTPVRVAITKALIEKFEFIDTLDEWLHAPNDVLDGVTPFERIVEGDGLAILRALGVTVTAPARVAGAPRPRRRSTLKIVR
jgi:hypothetical protein